MTENLHKGHRQKLRARYMESGFSGFADHEILELLLFYAYPQRDTNELAHRFINEYGSLYALMSDTPQNIMHRLNVTENIAVLLSSLLKINERVLTSHFKRGEYMGSFSRAAQYLHAMLATRPYEMSYAICLNSGKELIKAVELGRGNEAVTKVNGVLLARECAVLKPEFVILGHNHPSGESTPSDDDIAMTNAVMSALLPLGVRVLDHIIICSANWSESFSFAKNGML